MRRLIVVLLASVALAGCGIPEHSPSQQAPATADSTAPATLAAATTAPATGDYEPPATNGYGQPFTQTEKNFLLTYYDAVGKIARGACPNCDATPDSPIVSDTDRVEWGHAACDMMTSGKTGEYTAEALKTVTEERSDPPRHLHSILLVAAAGLILCPENEKRVTATN